MIEQENYENEYQIKDGKKIYPVANSTNKQLTIQDVKNILSIGGLEEDITHLELFQKAFVHKSYSKTSNFEKNEKYFGDINGLDFNDNKQIMKLQDESSEKIEFVGDGFIQSIVGYYLFKRYTTKDEGFLTRIRSRIVKTEGLSKFALILNFDKHIILSRHVEIIFNGRKNAKILEDAFEAFISALFEEFNIKHGVAYAYEKVNCFMVYLMENYVDWTEIINEDDNYKNKLMIYFQKNFNGKYPIYEKISEENKVNNIGQTNKKKVYCVKDTYGKVIGKGTGTNKTEAEQNAAKNALNYFGIF